MTTKRAVVSSTPSTTHALRAWFAIALLAFVGVAGAASYEFGTRRLEVPAPEGLEPAKAISPAVFNATEQYLPPGNRLVELFVTAEDAAALRIGSPAKMARQAQLQVLRALDGKPVSQSDFAEASSMIERELEKMAPKLDAEAEKLTNRGNAAVQQATGADVSVSMNGIKYLGVRRREPWGSFFTLEIGGNLNTDGQTESFRTYAAGAVALVNHQLVYLYSYVDTTEPDARQRAEASLDAWAQAIRALNPDDPALADTGGSAAYALGRILGMAFFVALVVFGLKRLFAGRRT